jgi:hypothetical protein
MKSKALRAIVNMDSSSDTLRRIAERRSSFMAEPTIEQARQIREVYAVELRSKKRTESLMKRRTVVKVSMKEMTSQLISNLEAIEPRLADHGTEQRDQILIIKEILSGAQTLHTHLMALTFLREMLTSGSNAPSSLIVELGLGPIVIGMCRADLPEEIISEAAWCLCNMASGNQESTISLVKDGAIEAVMTLLSLKHPLVLEHAVWTAGNIIGDHNDLRDMMLNLNILQRIEQLIEVYDSALDSVYPVVSWTCSNVMRKIPVPSLNFCEKVCVIMTRLAGFPSNPHLVHDLLWAICNFTDHENCLIQLVIDSPPLFEVILTNLESRDSQRMKAALRAAGNIVTGNVYQTETMLNRDILGKLKPILNNPDPHIRKEAYWTLSNIAASTQGHLELLLSHPLMETTPSGLIDVSDNVSREASFLFVNIVKINDQRIILDLVYKFYILDFVAQAMNKSDTTTLKVTSRQNLLKLSFVILVIGESASAAHPCPILGIFYDRGCVEQVQRLCGHDDEEISQFAETLLKKLMEERQVSVDYQTPLVFNFS